MDKIKITNHQLFSLTATGALGGPLVVISAVIASIAKQDAWITALVTPIFGIVVIWIYWFLGSQYPSMTFVEIIKNIFGKWIGLPVAVSFVFFYILIASHPLWYISHFVTTQAMPETPTEIISLLFVITVVVAVLYGIEAIARASEILILIASILFLLSMLLVLPNARIENLQPVLENGIIPVLKGSVVLSCLLTFTLVTLMMVYPINIDNISEAKKSLLKGYLWASFIIFITILMSVLVLGSEITAKTRYPTFLLAKEINVGMIFTRLEFVIAAVWIIAIFAIGTLFFHAGVTGLSQLLGLRDHKRIIIPLGLISLVLSEVVFPDDIYQGNWVNLVWIPYSITYGLILPILLLLVLLIKKYVFKVGVTHK